MRISGLTVSALAGLVLGCYLPFVLPIPLRPIGSQAWFIFVPIAIIVYILLRRRLIEIDSCAEQRVVYAFVPAVALLAMPLLWSSYGAQVLLVVLVLAAMILIGIALASGRLRIPALSDAATISVAGIFVSGLAAASILKQNPTFAHGAIVAPFDGENWLTWMSDGMLGRAPFRDFFFPYGPLLYYLRLLFAHTFGLDAYFVPYMTMLEFFAGLLAFYTVGVLLRWRSTVLVVAPAVLFLYGSEDLRVWVGCAAVVAALFALDRRTAASFLAAGVAAALAVLYSPEVGLAALIASAVYIFWFIYEKRKRTLAPGQGNAVWFLVGVAAVALPVSMLALVTHSLIPYVRQNIEFLSQAIYYAGLPFPPLFTNGGLAVPAGSTSLWPLGDPTFRTYYSTPVLLSIGLAVFFARIVARRRVSRNDRALGGLLIFSCVLFVSALGRSDAGHQEAISLPVILVALFLCEWSACTALQSLRDVRFRHRDVRLLRLCTQSAMYGVFIFFMLGGMLEAQNLFPALSNAVESDRTYYAAAQAAPDMVSTPSGWEAVKSADGQLFFFRLPQAADTPATLAYLEMRLQPGDSVCGFPFITRYEFLLHRASAVKESCDLWDMPATAERARYLQQIKLAKPRYLIYNEADTPSFDWVPWLDRAPEVAAYIFGHYHVVKRFGNTLVFERGGAGWPPSVIEAGSIDAVPFLMTGFYYPEADAHGSLRWTTPEATARIAEIPGDKFFDLDLSASTPQETAASSIHQSVTVSINGKRLLTALVPKGARAFRHLIAAIPAVRRPTVVSVSFSVTPPLTDPRMLGVPIVRFGFYKKPPVDLAMESGEEGAPQAQPVPATTAGLAPPGVAQKIRYYDTPVSATDGRPTNVETPIFVTMRGSFSHGVLKAIDVLQGNYQNTADGMLMVLVCDRQDCTSGTTPLTESQDNTFLRIPLKKPLHLRHDVLVLRFTDLNHTRPEALWTYDAPGSAGEKIRVGDQTVPHSAFKIRLEF